MSGTRPWIGGFLVACALACAPPAVRAQDDTYKQLVGQAMAEWDRGNWAESRALFLQAHRERPNARTWRALGKTAFELRRYVTAMRELQAALASQNNPLTDTQRAEVQALLERARAFVGSYEVSLSPPQAELLVDGKPAELDDGRFLFLSVGTHRLEARAEGYRPLDQPIAVEGGERSRLQLTLVPLAEPAPVAAPAAPTPAPVTEPAPAPIAEPPAPVAEPAPVPPPAPEVSTEATASTEPPAEPGPFAGRTWTWVALGGSAAFGIAAAAFWSSSGSAFEEVVSRCPDTCTVEQIEAVIDDSGGRTYDTLTNVSITLSAASLVAAVALYVLEGKAESRGDEGLALTPHPRGATLGGRF